MIAQQEQAVAPDRPPPPVRSQLTCPPTDSPRPAVQVLSWFTEGERAGRAGLRVCRVKNKFGFAREELVGGYRDLMFCVVYDGPRPALTPLLALYHT